MGWSKVVLREFLDGKGISPNSYSLNFDKDEAFCINQVGGEWLVYYSERGERNELGWGKSEAQALNILKLFVLEAAQKI